MKKILALTGSYRINGNSTAALNAFIKGIEKAGHKVEVIHLKDLDIGDCTDCRYCWKHGVCVYQDDMQILYKKFEQVDGVVLASPVYFNSVSALTKRMIDRCQMYWAIKYRYNPSVKLPKNKVGYHISAGGARYDNFQFSGNDLVMEHFFAAICSYHRGTYHISQTDDEGLENRKHILDELEELGENFFENKNFLIERV